MENTPEKIIEFEMIRFNPLLVRIIATLMTIRAVMSVYIAYTS